MRKKDNIKVFREIGLTLIFCAFLVGLLFKAEFYFLNSNNDKISETTKTSQVSNISSNNTRIAVGVGVLESIAKDLVKGTNVEIVPAYKDDVRINDQKLLIEAGKFESNLDPENITACISIRSISPYSKLFSYLRSKNIKIIEIDCASPVESNRRSVSLIERSQRSFDGGLFYNNIWQSPENTLRMVDLLAEDLCNITPEWKEQILANQLKLKKEITNIEVKYLAELSKYDNIDVFVLCDDFYYLTSNFQIFVADKFSDDGRKWDSNKLEKLKESLIDNDVKVVIHKWEPHESVVNAIVESGAKLVVLDPMDKTRLENISYSDKLKENLQKLKQAFE